MRVRRNFLSAHLDEFPPLALSFLLSSARLLLPRALSGALPEGHSLIRRTLIECAVRMENRSAIDFHHV
jgi:hypothetical protein